MSSSAILQTEPFRTVLCDSAEGKESWRFTCSRAYGLHCEFPDGRPTGSVATSWNLGQLDLLNVELAHQCLSPVAESSPDCPSDEYLHLKLVKAGSMLIEQDGQVQRFQAGGLLVVDSTKAYRLTFAEITQLIALRIPKCALRERGFRHELRGTVTPDTAAPDVQAVSGLILSMAEQAGATSKQMRRRQGEQVLDLIDLLLDDPGVLIRARSSEATLFRAKRYIAQNLRNPDLTATLIASAANASETHLHRLFKAEGTSLMRYVWTHRLELAARLLKEHNESRLQIQEVAYNCGFSTPAHFSRSFKDRYGVSPKDVMTADLILNRFDN
jgi:AraC-like DNA-binding protein